MMLIRLGELTLILALLITLTGVSVPAETAENDCVTALSKFHEFWQGNYEHNVSIKYQKFWKKYAHKYLVEFKRLKQEKSEEIKLFEMLGFEITENEIRPPTLETLVNNYNQYLDSKEIPQDSRILPAVTLKKGQRGTLSLFRPGHDSWPDQEGGDWLNAFNERLKSRDVIANVAEGRWPIFGDGYHDIFHLIVFALHPEYTRALREKHKALLGNATKPRGAVFSRSAYTIEALALADPNKIDQIKEHIVFNANRQSTVDDFLAAINLLTADQLNERVQYWLTHFQSYLTYYAAGAAEPMERNNYVEKQSFNFSYFYEPRYEPSLSRIMPLQILTESMTYMPEFLKNLLKQLAEPKGSLDKSELDRLVRLQLARMEYALWKSGTEITVTQWIQDMIAPNVDINSPAMKFVHDVFGPQTSVYTLLSDQN